MKNLRYVQQTDRARIEHDLVLTRIGELSLRDDNLLIRGMFYTLSGLDGAIVEGLISTPGSGLSVDLSVPAIALQKITDLGATDEVKFVADSNDTNPFNIVLDAADISNDRIDIIEARIETRSTFTDDNVSIADPVTKVISATTRDRDYEVYLNIVKKTGTPAGSPVPPSPTSAIAGILTGSVDINTGTTDLSVKYNFNFAIGPDTEFVTVDLRGATPSATTAAEILAALNGAGFGTVAALNGNFLEITAPGTGENSVVKVKQPLDASLDAYNIVTGNTESPGYFDNFIGDNAFFKLAEIFVPATATSLTAANVRSREEKDTDWDADASTIENIVSLDTHRKSNPLDHVDGSIFINHLDSSVLSLIGSKITKYRGAFAPVYFIVGDATFRQGAFMLQDIEIVKEAGLSQDNVYDQEQEFPINRVDQREEDFSSGSGYPVPVSISEAASDRRLFVPGSAVNDGTNNYTVQTFAGNHSRIGVYITNGGSIANFTDLRITLHDTGDAVEGFADIPIADLQAVGTGWIYVDLTASLTPAVTYHFHFEMIGETSPTAPILGNQSGTGADTLAFREMYLPSSGKYGSVNEADVVKLLDDAGARLIPIRSSGDDDIITPGDGFLGERTGTNYDVIYVDFSNTTFWQNWRYEDYIGFDLTLGRVKLPPSLSVRDIFAEFNITEGLDAQDIKNVLSHNRTASIEDILIALEEEFRIKEITDAEADLSTTIYPLILDNTPAIMFPNTGTPLLTFQFKVRNPGIYHNRPIFFEFLFAMDSADTGVVKIDMAIRVNGVSITSRTQTIDPPDTTSRDRIVTSSLFIDAGDFAEGDSITINMSRDNGVGSNHTGEFGLFNLGVI